MRKLKQIGIALAGTLALSASFPAHADDGACADQNDVSGSIQAQSIQMHDRCMVMISPTEHGSTYRSYSFTSEGGFMVFNGLGDGPNSTSTGARYFFLFPRGRMPSYDVMTTGDVEVRLASGQLVRFSSDTARLQSISGDTFTEAPEVSASNHGGVEITSTGTLMLDCGFRVGESPQGSPSRSSVFRDPQGHSCQVTNREIFTYAGDPKLRFATDAELARFLSTRCPRLDTSSLNRPVQPQPPAADPADSSSSGAGRAE